MAKARSWIVDAALLQDDSDDVDAFRRRILHATGPIADFLSRDGGRDSLYVIAPKGFGKTLLLQAKRLLLQHDRRGLILSPANLVVDRPENLPVSWTREQLEGFVGDYRYWVELWGMAIRIAAVRTWRRAQAAEGRGDPAEDDALLEALASPRLRQVMRPGPGPAPVLSDVFAALLRVDRREYFRILDDVADHISPLCRGIHSGMAFFIDNLDEMFHRSIQDAVRGGGGGGGAGRRGGDAEEPGGVDDRLGEVWALAQLGLARAAFDVNRINPHIRVYSTLRREAWLRLRDFDPNAAQMHGRALEVAYTPEDLKAIFLKNVENEPAANLAEPRAPDPLARFVGAAGTWVLDDHARRPEPLLDFVLRHTLLRPRDLMLVGEAISAIPPARRDLAAIKAAVAAAAGRIAEWYQGEMSLFVHRPDRRLYQLIDRNVLTAADLARIAAAYAEGLGPEAGEEARHPFCALYKLGLLGVVAEGAAGGEAEGADPRRRQRFAGPDEIAAEGRVGILPRSPVYLVHPALDLTVERAHGLDYRRNHESRNLVGHGRPWSDDAVSVYVMKGDVVGSSRAARHPDFVETWPVLFRAWAEQECARLGVRHHAVERGDALVLVDGSAAKLLAAARAILQRMEAFRDFPCTMRFGAAAGVVHGLQNGEVAGSVLGTAARLEPTAQHGTVVATDAFWENARPAWDPATARPLDEGFKAFRHQGGKFLIRKNAREPAVVAGLWRIRLLPPSPPA